MTGFTAENRLFDIQVFSVCYLPGINCVLISVGCLIFFQNCFFRYTILHQNIFQKIPFRFVCPTITFFLVKNSCKSPCCDTVSSTGQDLWCKPIPVKLRCFFRHLRISVSRNKDHIRFFRLIFYKHEIFYLFQKLFVHYFLCPFFTICS